MNIWALSKDVYLKHILLVLAEKFGADSFVLSAHWRDDFHAVGISRPDNPDLLAHVFTYGQAAGKFGVHLEFPEQPDSIPAAVAKEKEDISLNDLVGILAVHLELEPRSP
jgi:hypothetical protein